MTTLTLKNASGSEINSTATHCLNFSKESLEQEESKDKLYKKEDTLQQGESSTSVEKCSSKPSSFPELSLNTSQSQVNCTSLQKRSPQEDTSSDKDKGVPSSTESEEEEEEDEENDEVEEDDTEEVQRVVIHSDEEAKQLRQEALKFYNNGEYDEAMKLQYLLVRYAVRQHDGVTDPRNGMYFLDYGLSQLRLLQTSSTMDDVFSEEKRSEAEKDMEACFINLDVARVCFRKQVSALEEEQEEKSEIKTKNVTSLPQQNVSITETATNNDDGLPRRVQVELTLAEVHNALAQLLVEKGDFSAALQEYDTELFIYQCLEEETGESGGEENILEGKSVKSTSEETNGSEKKNGEVKASSKKREENKMGNKEEDIKKEPSSFVVPPGRVVACLYGAADCFLKEADFEGAEERLQSALDLIRERYSPSLIDPAIVEELEDWLTEAREMKGGTYAAMQESIHQQFARDEMAEVLAQAEAMSAAAKDKISSQGCVSAEGARDFVGNSHETPLRQNLVEKNEDGREKVCDAEMFHHSAVKKEGKGRGNNTSSTSVEGSSAISLAPPSTITSHPFLSALPLQEENYYSSSALQSREHSSNKPFSSIMSSSVHGTRSNSNSSFTLGLTERSQSISLFPSQHISSQCTPFQVSSAIPLSSTVTSHNKDAGKEEKAQKMVHTATVVKKVKKRNSPSTLSLSCSNSADVSHDAAEDMAKKKVHIE